MRKYIITGTGRCGTGGMAALLTACGVECGHEQVFSPFNDATPASFKHVVAESSWLALEHKWAFNGRNVIHVMRDPLLTFESFMRIRQFHDDAYPGHQPYTEAMYRMHPVLRDLAPEEAAAEWMSFVFRELEALPHPVTLVKIDRLDTYSLSQLLGIRRWLAAKALHETPTNVNSRRRNEPSHRYVPTIVEEMRYAFGYTSY